MEIIKIKHPQKLAKNHQIPVVKMMLVLLTKNHNQLKTVLSTIKFQMMMLLMWKIQMNLHHSLTLILLMGYWISNQIMLTIELIMVLLMLTGELVNNNTSTIYPS